LNIFVARRGHRIIFAEPDAYGRQEHRDDGDYSYVESIVYKPDIDVNCLLEWASGADIVIKHSGIGVEDALLETRVLELKQNSRICFWDVDAPATVRRLHTDAQDSFRAAIPQYDAILTYGGGPRIQDEYLNFGARAYYSIYNGLDPETHYPVPPDPELACDVVFLGNRLPDREARVEELFLNAAELAPDQQFILGGEGWSDKLMPPNVRWIGHVRTNDHNRVNCSAGMVMNINRSSMASFGFSPPTRVFEVAGAGACMLCDDWPGIDDCFEPEKEIVVIRTAQDVVDALRHHDKAARQRIGETFYARALRNHTYAQRAEQAEKAFLECIHRKKDANRTEERESEPVEEHA
jgi:spore maturation protein CgeB